MIRLETLADNSPADRNFETLMRWVPDAGGPAVGFRFGTVVLAFSASATASAVVPHGLGKTPVAVLLTTLTTTGFRAGYSALGATSVTVNGFTPTGATTTANLTVSWMVIG